MASDRKHSTQIQTMKSTKSGRKILEQKKKKQTLNNLLDYYQVLKL